MNELISIRENKGKQVVSARELYNKLGLSNGQFSRWAKSNIWTIRFLLRMKIG